MRYETPANPNYVATIVEVKATHTLDGLDNLVGINFFGTQALVSKDVAIGTVGVLFTAETQLSEEFAKMNNLHRHTDRNKDESQSGYLEDSRRVKAIRLRGNRSDALFLQLDSFRYLGINPADFSVGDVFDKLNGHEICKKYVLKEPGVFKGAQGKTRRVDLKVFPTHIDTENYWRNSEKIPAESHVVITQKLHGTSARFGRVPVLRELTWKERIAKKLGIAVQTHDMKAVAGSRMVVKSIDGDAEEGKQNFYNTDIWSEWSEKIKDAIPENFLVYGELIGYTSDGKPIQKDYTYNLSVTESELYIYRVAVVTPQGRVIDLSWEQVKTFCEEGGLKHVPELASGPHSDFVPEVWIDKDLHSYAYGFLGSWDKEAFPDRPIPLSNSKTVDEGVCVRYDGPNGIYILKAKSPIFLAHESKMLDQEVVDLEAEESA